MLMHSSNGRLMRSLFVVLATGLIASTTVQAQTPAPLPRPVTPPDPQAQILAELKAINERLDRLTTQTDERFKNLDGTMLAQGLIPRTIVPDPKLAGPPAGKTVVTMLATPGEPVRFQVSGRGTIGTGLLPQTEAGFRATVNALAVQPQFVNKSFLTAGATFPAQFDLRDEVQRRHGRRPALTVRHQQDCGSCWAFAAVAAMEANHALRFGGEIDPSEQVVLDCSRGSCRGATMDVGPAFLASDGTIGRTEAGGAYVAQKQACRAPAARAFKATAFGFVNPRSTAPPTVQELKQAITDHGAVMVGINATRKFIEDGFNGEKVFLVNESGPVTHAIVIIGWDDRDQTWLIKNSWGSDWGDRGFMRVRFGANSIGAEACWVDAVQTTGPTPVVPDVKPLVTDGYLVEVNKRIDWWQANFPQFIPTKP